MTKYVTFALAILLCGGGSSYGEGVHWTYSGDTGPEHWGELDESFEMCAKGKNQSPINLTDFIEADLPPIRFAYGAPARTILNNGHTIQVAFEAGNQMTIDGDDFRLLQFHFHAPSENHIDAKSFPMEAHLVHANDQGDLAVVAVMFESGEPNTLLDALWQQMPKVSGDEHPLPEQLMVDGLLPEDRDYYRFNGSLTTPPGTEGVRWFVLKEAVSASAEQIKTFEHVIHHPNNRPIQPTNARVVLK
ncbi:MAG: carbonic anhydrase [Verrucomicrobia bacterium]|nr:carbonic anhydrase [Verrucomicrobiota bacterium]